MASTSFLGTIETRVVGIQYYDVGMGSNDEVFFEREPSNEFDANAIEVRNHHGEILGHLPREDSLFLAPLIDGGKIFLKGRLAGEPEFDRVPLRMEVQATDKGKDILHPRCRDNPYALIHEFLAQVFRSERHGAETLKTLQHELKRLLTVDLPPEARLLHRLLEGRAYELEAKAQIGYGGALRKGLSAVSLGTAQSWEGLCVFPLIAARENGGFNGLILSEALAQDLAEVTEICESGHVPELKVVNRSGKPLLLLAGDLLRGAKQDRIVNTSLLIFPQTEQTIPVSCVEQGRWSYSDRRFRAAGRAPGRVRKSAMRGVRENLRRGHGFRSDQAEVWREVSMCLDDMRRIEQFSAPSESISDGIEATRERAEAASRAIPCPDGAVGMIAYLGGEFAGIEFFADNALATKVWENLVQSLAFDALGIGAESEDVQPSRPRRKLQLVQNARTEAVKSVGAGFDITVLGDSFEGAGLIHEEQLLHLSIFSQQ